ncbi:hypothetical protein FOZ63_014149, partial [Perkinsus olseni]
TPVELKQAQKDEEFAAQRAYRESRRRMLKGAARRGVELAAESTGGKQSETASSTTSEHRDDDDDDMELSSNATGEAVEDEEEEAPDHDFEARDEAMQDQKVDDGAACAIRYFVERGMMSGDQDSFNSYDPGKRPMTSEEAELRIDHRDEFGRVQSAKEAFRTMSWRFHGKGPHWKNVERRVNRIQNDIKRRQETSQVAPTLRALERVQKQEGNSASPTLLFTCGGVCGTLALILIVFGIVVRTLFYPTLIDGIDKMRYIDNTKEVEGECSNLLLGDLTCPGLAYQAWLMSSAAARQVCLSDTKPDTKAIEIWSGWCDEDDEEGEGRCVKPDMCRYGLPYTFYPYTVTNPKEILLEGKKPIIEELEPILLASTHQNIQDLTDIELWDTEGIARWEEVNTFVPANGDDTYVDDRMSQRIIVPNIALLGTMFFEGQEATPLGTLEVLGVLGVIQSVARTLTGSIDTAPATLKTPVLGQFTTSENAAKMQYFHSSLSLLLGPSAGLSGELSLKALGPLFTSSLPNGDVLAASLPPTEMGSEFFAYTFGCVALHHRQTASCIYDENIEEHRSRRDAIQATYSADSQERIWRFIYDTDFNQQTQATISLFILQSQLTASEYAAFITHIVYAGSYALSNYDPLRHAIWPVTDPNSPDYDSDYDYYPRFINMTIAQLLGYKGEYFFDKATSTPITLGSAGSSRTAHSEQYVSSKYGRKGLFYYRMYDGVPHACTFDKDCMSQDSFITNGTCEAGRYGCDPTLADGYDIRYIPGTLNGKEDDAYHKEGAEVTLFVTDVFNRVTFENTVIDMDWDGLKVDRWRLRDVTFRVENCYGENPVYSAGIDCKSPHVTADLGYYFSPDPTLIKLPIYASLPHFADTGKMTSIDDNYYPGDGRIEVKKCTIHETCQGDRDFISEIWTEPITGTLMYGTQKLQFNSHFTPLANTSDGKLSQEALLPLFWVDKHAEAWPFQVDAAKAIQRSVALFSSLGIILIVMGALLGILAGLMIRAGRQRRLVGPQVKPV